jgi:hypothetical protein
MFRLIAFKLTDEIDDDTDACRRICTMANLKDWQVGKHKVSASKYGGGIRSVQPLRLVSPFFHV